MSVTTPPDERTISSLHRKRTAGGGDAKAKRPDHIAGIGKRTVDGLSAAEDTVFWDHDLPGYGVRVYPTGRKVYVVQSRGPGGPKRVTLGRHGEISAEQARGKAAGVIDRIKRGEDPVPPPPAPGLTVADLAERYMEGHVAVNCNAHTAGIYRGSLGNHILPALGGLAIEAVGREHAAALHYGLRDTPRAANRALMVLTKMFSLAELRRGAWPRRGATRAASWSSTGSIRASGS